MKEAQKTVIMVNLPCFSFITLVRLIDANYFVATVSRARGKCGHHIRSGSVQVWTAV